MSAEGRALIVTLARTCENALLAERAALDAGNLRMASEYAEVAEWASARAFERSARG